MDSPVLELLVTNVPWSVAVLVPCLLITAMTIMFVIAIIFVPAEKRVEAIDAMARFVQAIRPGRPKRIS